MTTYLTVADVKLVEAGGEEFKTVAQGAVLTITSPPLVISVGGNAVPLNTAAREPFKRIGRDFKFAGVDLLTTYYVSLPAGLDEAVYDRFEELVGLALAGKPLTPPKPKPAPAAAQAGGDAAAAGGAKPGGAGLFGALRELGQKAAQDTLSVAAAIRAKAEHDIKAVQDEKARQVNMVGHPQH